MERRNFLKPYLAIIVVFALTLPPVIYWHVVNRSYPRWDAAQFLLQSMDVYRRFIIDGFAAGVRALYEIRTFRTIIHPLLALPAFFLLGPHVLLVQAVVQISLYAALAWIIYLLCRLYLTPVDSVLVTSIAVNTPAMNEPAHAFNAELPFAVFLSAALLALSRSDFFSKKWPTLIAALFFGLALCTRPAEAVLRISVLLPFLIHAAIKHGKCRLKEIQYAGILVLICGIAVAWAISTDFVFSFQWLPVPDYRASFIAIGGLLVAWVVYFFHIRRKTRSFFPLHILLASTVAILWYAAYLQAVFLWSVFCSYSRGSDMSLLLEPRMVGLNVYHDVYKGYVGPVGLGFFAICIACGWKIIFGKVKESPLRIVLLAILLTLAIHIGLGALSYQPLPRYYCLEVTALWATFAMIFLGTQCLQWVKRTLVFTISVFLILTQLNVYGAIHVPSLLWGKEDSAPFWSFVLQSKDDQATPLLESLVPEMQQNPNLFGCIYMVPTPPSRSISLQDMVTGPSAYTEAWTLRLMAREKNLKFDPMWLYQRFEDWDQWRSHEGQGFDNCLIGPMEWANQEFLNELNHDKSIRKEQFVFHYGDAQATLLLVNLRKAP